MRPCLTSTWKGCDTGLCGGIPNRISSRPASEAIHDSEDVAEVLGWRRCPCSELCLCLRKPDSNTARPQLQKFDWDGVKLRCVVELGINGGDSGIRSNRNSGSSRQWRWRRTAADVDLAGCWHLWKITKKIIEKALRNVKRSCWGHQFCGSKAFSRIQQESNVS